MVGDYTASKSKTGSGGGKLLIMAHKTKMKLLTIEDIKAVLNHPANESMTERQFNTYLIETLKANKMSLKLFLEYLEITQGDLRDLLS